MILFNLHIPAKKLNEFDSNINDDFQISAIITQSNNVSIKSNCKKYKLQTHKIGIIYKNAIMKGYKGDQNKFGGHLMPAF